MAVKAELGRGKGTEPHNPASAGGAFKKRAAVMARGNQQTAAALHATGLRGGRHGGNRAPSQCQPPVPAQLCSWAKQIPDLAKGDPPALWFAATWSTSVSESLLSLLEPSAGAAFPEALAGEFAAVTAAFPCPTLPTDWGGTVFGAWGAVGVLERPR